MRIDGEVKGELHSADTITIGKDGIIEGNLRAKDIVVGGRVNGSISASGKITLESKSTLDGDLRASRLVIEEGAAFNGHSDMRSEGAKVPKIPQPAHINLTKD